MSEAITRIAISAYRPEDGKEQVLLSEVRDHHPLLWSEGLVTGRQPIILRAKDGTILEIFEWASPAAIEEAHDNPRVTAMWERFARCCDYVPLSDLSEAALLFAEFEPLDIEFPPRPEVPPDQREE